jgi:hypothetical protein
VELMTDTIARPRAGWVAPTTALAWLGFFVHNVADVPGQSLGSAETGLPTLVYLVLLLTWWRAPASRGAVWLLLGWSLLNLVGGGLSVVPFPFLPFVPEQSVRHYLFHVVYAAAQLPLIRVTWAWLHGKANR